LTYAISKKKTLFILLEKKKDIVCSSIFIEIFVEQGERRAARNSTPEQERWIEEK